MAVELGQGYVSIVAETSKLPGQIKSALDGSQVHADRSGQGMGSKLAAGLGKTLKVGAVGAGVAVGGVLATSITKGMGRLIAIENAEGKLAGLGHSAETVAKIMDNALASVKGTSFGLGDAASIAASAVAAGVKPGKELERTLKLTGDAATIAGVDIQSMGAVFNKVAAANRIRGGEIMQLNKMGIPVVQLLGKELGKTSDEILDMTKKGQVNFADFQNAMEKGLGGAALTSGATFAGALANMGAAMGRFGAELMGPLFRKGPATFGLLTAAIDKGTEAIKPFTAAFASWLDSDAIPKLASFGKAAKAAFDDLRGSDFVAESMARLGGIFSTLGSAASVMWPAIKQIGVSLAEAAAATGVSSWKILLSAVESVAVIFDTVVAPVLSGVGSLMESNQGAVTGLAMAFLAFRTVPALFTRMGIPIQTLGTRLNGVSQSFTRFGQQMTVQQSLARGHGQELGRVGAAMATVQARVPAIGRMGEAYRGAASGLGAFAARHRESAASLQQMAGQSRDAFKTVDLLGRAAGNNAAAGIATLGRTAAGIGAAGMSGFRTATSGVINALGGFTGIGMMAGIAAIMSVTSAVQATNRQNKIMESSANAAAAGMSNLTDAFVKADGKIDSGVFAEVGNQVAFMRRNLDDASKTGPGWFERNIMSFDRAGKEARKSVADAAAATEQAFDKLGWSNERLSEAVTGSSADWYELRTALLATGEGGADAVGKLTALRNNFERLERISKVVTPGSMEVAAAFKEIGNEAASADTKTSALKRALDAMAGGVPDLAEATDDFGKVMRSIDSATEEAWDKTKGWGDELVKADGSINVMTENGSQLLGFLMEMRNTTAGVAMSGGDMNEAWAENEIRLQALADAAGLPLPVLKEMAAGLGLIPSAIDTAVSVSGAGALMAELGSIKTEFDRIEGDDKRIVVAALTDKAEAALESLDYKVTELDDGTFEIIPKTEEAEGKLATMIEMVTSIPDNKILDVTAPGSEGVIDALNTIGIKVHENNDKQIVIEDNSPDTIRRLDALNITTTTLKDGTVVVKDNVEDVKRNVNGLNSLRTSSKHTVHVAQQIANQISPGLGTFYAQGADGGISGDVSGLGLALRSFANGKLPDEAMIAPGRGAGLIQWAEGETGGEAFIPLAESKRPRSLRILESVAERFGLRLESFADGGIRNALSVARSKEGNLYSWGGIGPDRFDCSGFVGFIQQIVMGISEAAAAGKRLYTTNSLLGGQTAGLVRGYNPNSPFNVGVSNDHMAATVGGVNVESGGASSPSSSGVGPSRAGALDPQFGTQFHLPVELIEGGYEEGAVYAATGPVWSEKDELELKSARVAITQAQEAVAKARSNPKKSQADIEQAELKVARAEQKVADLEDKKEGKTGVQALTAPPAPPLGGTMDEDAISLRQAELAVTDAQLARDRTYADPKALSSDKEKADLAVYSAQNRLVETQKQLAESNKALAATGGVKGILQRGASDAVGVGYDAFWDIIGFNEPRWFGMDIPTVPDKQGKSESVSVADALQDVPSSFSDAEIANQNPASDMEAWLKKQKIPLHDDGGWLEPGLTLNLTKKPEAVFSHDETATFKRLAANNQLGNQNPQDRVVEVHHHYHLTDVNDIERLKRQDRQRQLLQRGG